jgi:hypothetical protein
MVCLCRVIEENRFLCKEQKKRGLFKSTQNYEVKERDFRSAYEDYFLKSPFFLTSCLATKKTANEMDPVAQMT